jgi:hypothetical protein
MRILPGASRRIFRFSRSRAVPRAHVNKPKRLGTRLALEEEIDFEVVEVCKFSTSFKVIIMQTSNMEIYSKLYSELYLFKTLFIQNFIYLYSKRLRNLFLLLLLEILG